MTSKWDIASCKGKHFFKLLYNYEKNKILQFDEIHFSRCYKVFLFVRDSTCVARIRRFCIGPCHSQQRGRSRAQTQHEGGSRDLNPDHEERAWERDTLWPRAGDKNSGMHQPPSPSPPHQGSQGRAPSHPLLVPTPPPAKVLVEASLGRKHTSASGTRSEAMDRARGGCGEHCELFSSSLGGQTAELVTSAGWPASYPIALPTSWMWNPLQASTRTRTRTTRQVNGRPVQDRSLYKESPCTFLPLSYNTRRSLHL